MSKRLSVSTDQLRSVDVAAQSLPVEARNRFKYSVLFELEIHSGQRAVSDTDIERAIARTLRTMPAPAMAL